MGASLFRLFLTGVVLGLWIGVAKAAPEKDSLYQAKSLPAIRTEQAPRIDGILDEDCWQRAVAAEGFITTQPEPGQTPTQDTRFYVLYDDDALYIGAIMRDPNPDSIEVTLSQRDEAGNADWMIVLISPYADGANGFGFGVTAAGVQIDEKWTGFNNDRLWDGVWESSVQVGEQGWIAEIAIPYGALRFKSADVQDWGINVFRHLRRIREESWWSPVDVREAGLLQQTGRLTGLRDIRAPFRLSITPYLSSFVELRSNPQQNTTESVWDVNGGLDLKYGINDAFTLDMTMIPDFNQVRFDNQVLNLSPFEVFFNENRAFFTEGTELFNKQGLFYSRRIGGRPPGFFSVQGEVGEGEELIINPAESRLFNATKVSGRTDSGLGIGVFNAITGQTEAIIRSADGTERAIETAPLSNYNVFVLDQNLKRDNSFVTFTHTGVWRSGSFTDASVSGILFRIRDKKGVYQLETNGALSQRYRPEEQRPDLGHNAGLEISRVNGNFRFNTGYFEESDTYNPNDLGFLSANNERNAYLFMNYDWYEPVWRFNRLYHFLGTNYQRVYEPNAFFNFGVYSEAVQIWKSFNATGIFFNTEPVVTYDWFEPREPGRFLVYPVNYTWGGWFSSDYRKTLALDLRLEFREFNFGKRETLSYYVAPRWQVNDNMLLIVSFQRDRFREDLGWVNTLDDGTILIGKRNVSTSESGIQANYIFTNRMFLTLRVRHYWSRAVYLDYYELGLDGLLYESGYDGIDAGSGVSNHDVNFNAFTVDAAFTWRFAPGSDLFLVWKEGIFEASDQLEANYFSNLRRTFQAEQSNNLSLRLVYYLDYVQVKKWSRKNRDPYSVPIDGDAFLDQKRREVRDWFGFPLGLRESLSQSTGYAPVDARQ